MAEQTAEFKKATEEVKKLDKAPSQKEQLKLYGLFKVANGFNKENPPPKPSFWEMEKSEMYKAWERQVAEGTNAPEAQKEYIELVEKHKKTYGFSG